MAGFKLGNEEQEKYRWIRLHHRLSPKKWSRREMTVRLINDVQVLTQWLFKAVTKYQPELTQGAVYSIDRAKDCCKYYHRDISFEFILTSPEDRDSDHLELTVRFIPQSIEKQNDFIGYKCQHHHDLTEDQNLNLSSNCRSFIWIFDVSLVKMTFRSPNDATKSITKRFHLEMEMDNESSSSKDGKMAEFTNSEFISKSDFERKLGYKLDLTNCERFIPVDVEIIGRFRLVSLSNKGQICEIVDLDCLTENPRRFPTRFLSHEFESFGFGGSRSFTKMKLSSESTGVKSCSDKCWSGQADEFDILIQIGSEVTNSVKAHSWILKCASPVFNKMLSSDFLEKKSGVIKLEESVDTSALEKFLQFLYQKIGLIFGHCNHSDGSKNDRFDTFDTWTATVTFKILELAHRYQVLDLYELCIENIISRPDSEFDAELVEEILEGSQIYGEEDLAERCEHWMMRHV